MVKIEMTTNAYQPTPEEEKQLTSISERLFVNSIDYDAVKSFRSLSRPQIQWVIRHIKTLLRMAQKDVPALEEWVNHPGFSQGRERIVVPFDAGSRAGQTS